jgi:hypothetical protein
MDRIGGLVIRYRASSLAGARDSRADAATPDVAEEIISELPHLAGNLFHDAHTAILMREHGIKQLRGR